jgi:two-component sensor histidine kinase
VNYRAYASYVLRTKPWSPHAILLALLAVALATGLRTLVGQFGATVVFATYYPAILVVAVLAGAPAAILAALVTSVFAWWAYIPPAFTFAVPTSADLANLATFWLSASLIIWLSQMYRNTLMELLDSQRVRELLIGELNHRAGNMLTVLQAIVFGTVADKCDRERLMERIQALARANRLVSETTYGYLTLDALIKNETDSHAAPERLHTEGPQVWLDGEIARGVALVLHELLTNAAKYGALSNASGRVRIEWSCDDGNCRLRWTELGGPTVPTPTRVGFGSRMMKASVAQIAGTITSQFLANGFCCVLSFRTAAPKPDSEGPVGATLTLQQRPDGSTGVLMTDAAKAKSLR